LSVIQTEKSKRWLTSLSFKCWSTGIVKGFSLTSNLRVLYKLVTLEEFEISEKILLTDLCGVSLITCCTSATFSSLRLVQGRPWLPCVWSSTLPCCSNLLTTQSTCSLVTLLSAGYIFLIILVTDMI
jgi:hypothetical protein